MSNTQRKPDESFSAIGRIPLGQTTRRDHDPQTTAALDARIADWRRLQSLAVPRELQSLLRVFELATEQKWEIAITDIERVEALWEMLDCFSTSHGFVLSLMGGQRAYLTYFSDNEVEEVKLDPMGDERYPPHSDTPSGWSDDVGALNALLRS